MATEKSRSIESFEAWLKPGLFYFFLALLVLLNMIVWFGWRPQANANSSPEVITGLRSERDRLQALLVGACTSAELQSYGKGEAGPLLPSGTASGPKTVATQQDSLVALLQSAAVVVVHPEGSGSGFFIDPTTIVTNRHVIEGVKGGTVLISSKAIGAFLKAKIISVTRGSNIGGADFALLRLEQSPAGINVLPISRQPAPLQHVVAVGFPGSGIRSDQSQVPAPIYTSGDVSAVQPQSSEVTLIIHTADISPGSSGGALVDRCGSVVGVNTFVQSPDSKAEGRRLYALSADSLRKFLDESGQRYTNAADCQAGRVN
jgi:S1-C subfamily serine protease